MQTIVLNDSYKSEGFEQAVKKINDLLKEADIPIVIESSFIEDYIDDDGEFAWKIAVKEITNDN